MRKLASDPAYVSIGSKKRKIDSAKPGSRIDLVDSDDEEQITRLKGGWFKLIHAYIFLNLFAINFAPL